MQIKRNSDLDQQLSVTMALKRKGMFMSDFCAKYGFKQSNFYMWLSGKLMGQTKHGKHTKSKYVDAYIKALETELSE